jgi:hypothetical protein
LSFVKYFFSNKILKMTSQCSDTNCSERCKSNNTLVNGIQNQTLDLYNRTTYLSAPYSIGAPLASVVPSAAFNTAPIQSGFAVAHPFAATPFAATPFAATPFAGPPLSAFGPPVASQVSAPVTAQGTGPMTTSSVSGQMGAQYTNNGSTLQNVLSGTPSNGTKPIQKSAPPAPNPMNIIGPSSSSSKNLMTATGQACCDDDFSTPIEQKDNMDYIPYTSYHNANALGAAPVGAAPVGAPIASAPIGIAVGGVGGVAVAAPGYLNAIPNINAASGIAFDQDCALRYGLNAPLAVAGPITPAVSVLSSNYLSNLAVTPYYSGLNQSEPAAIMHSSNPVYPGFMMLARQWHGVPAAIISKPDRFGCPQFETISLEEHNENCDCERCKCFCINNCEYDCINGFGTPNAFSTNLLLVNGNLISSDVIGPSELNFTIVRATDGYPMIPSAGLTAFNTSGLALNVNGKTNRNIVLYKNCTYKIKLSIADDLSKNVIAADYRSALIFTIDPAGQNLDPIQSNNPPGLEIKIQEFILDTGFNKQTGLAPNHIVLGYTPSPDNFGCLVTTIYYQFYGFAYGGGPITVLGD